MNAAVATRSWCLVVVLCLLPSAPARAQAPPTGAALAHHPEVAAALTVLDTWIAAAVSDRELPGLAIGIVHDQGLLWAKGYGWADPDRRIAATPATAYRIGSLSKLLTTTAIMQLRDAGKLRLDDPVAAHLPWFQMRGLEAGAPPISIRHLLTHTGGLPREVPGFVWNDPRPVAAADVHRVLPATDVIYPVERRWKYSNLAYGVLGEVVAAASGEPWDRYVEAHILRPLGMNGTRALPGADMPGLAPSFGRRIPGAPREPRPHVDLGWLSSAGSLASTVEDLARFVSLQFREGPAGGAQALSGWSVREMHRPQWMGAGETGQGLGFALRRVGTEMRVGHGGALAGFRAGLNFVTERKLGVIVLTNSADGARGVTDQAFTIVGAAVAKATERPRAARGADPAWAAYVGTYASSVASSEIQITVLDGELTLLSPDADNPWTSRIVLQPIGAHTFRMQTGWAAGEALRFELDAAGRVARIVGPGVVLRPR